MKIRTGLLIGVLLSLPFMPPLCAVLRAAEASDPAVTIGERSVTIQRIVPGGSVALYALLTEGKDYYVEQTDVAVVLDDSDHDGKVTYENGRTIPQRSIFFAVDMTNGSWSAATPPGFKFDAVDLPRSAFVSRNGKDVGVRKGAPVLEVIHVRPGEGAWRYRSGDGGASDGDGTTDGVITLLAQQFRPIRGAKASDGELRPNDVVIVIDPLRSRYSARRVGRPE